jgi:hypothetical protein
MPARGGLNLHTKLTVTVLVPFIPGPFLLNNDQLTARLHLKFGSATVVHTSPAEHDQRGGKYTAEMFVYLKL